MTDAPCQDEGIFSLTGSTPLRSPESAAHLQEIPDLAEQNLGQAWACRRGILMQAQPGQRLDNPEDCEAYDEKLDDRVEKESDVHGCGACVLCGRESRFGVAAERNEDVSEVDTADDQPYNRSEDVLD